MRVQPWVDVTSHFSGNKERFTPNVLDPAGCPTMDLSGLYELLERFHRTNQLPAFVLGFVALRSSWLT